MFTGIIEELGKVRHITNNSIEIECKTVLEDSKIGDSIAVNGVCLTITALLNCSFIANISPETFRVTALNNLHTGSIVNLERAMPANGRFGGHIVSGHIDDKGKVLNIRNNNSFHNMEFELSDSCAKYAIKKGSITINGISLTIAEISKNIITIAVIPHTYENTNLKFLNPGDFVNIEVDITAKYIEKFLSTGDNKSRIDNDFLLENGF